MARTMARAVVVLATAACCARMAEAQTTDRASSKAKGKSAKPADTYDEIFAQYLQQARKTPAPGGGGADNWSWMNGLANDRRAHLLNDLIQIRVVENITASGSADAQLAKASDSTHSLGSLFGLEKKLPGIVDPTSLVSTKNDSNFKGAGTTNRAGLLTALLTARVNEVLPSGDLVVEGVREIEINGDTQVVVLSGVVRVTDVGTDNVVPSTSIGQLRIRYFGRGLMKDNLQPGFLIRVLNKVF
jgi:flagellar L-ring protein precursor FlgH